MRWFLRREANSDEKLPIFSEHGLFEGDRCRNQNFNRHFHCRFTHFPLVNLLPDRRFFRDGTGSIMKAKVNYSGLDSFSLSFSAKKSELLQLSGGDASVTRINDLFDSGREEEARMALRKALDEITRDVTADRCGGSGRRGSIDRNGPDTVSSLLLDLEF